MITRFVALFSALYLAFGVASPFFPAFLASRGLLPEQIGLVLSLGTAIRVISAPLAGQVADRLHALHLVLSICTATSAVLAFCFLPAQGFTMLLMVGVLHQAMLAPTTVLADALALAAASPAGLSQASFEYGWVRGAGSAAFILGSLLSGQATKGYGFATVLMLQAVFLVAATSFARFVPEPIIGRNDGRAPATRSVHSVFKLAGIPAFRLLVIIAALVLGSHAMHDSFAMIRWNADGISAGVGSILWSESVAAEVVVFLWIGPLLLRYMSAEAAMTISACAAILRWAVMGKTSAVAALALVEPLHGLTFALLHLSCMRVLVNVVPGGMAATAQAVYATVGIAAASAALTFFSGVLYDRFGGGGFFVMALLPAASLPVIWSLYQARRRLTVRHL
jgi:PPP family 3-phenylpropionic acid transporter